MIEHACLEGFLAFAEHMSFTHGARDAHVTQPALHAQVRRLATSVGAPLYTRSGRGLALTAAGRRLVAFARETLERSRALLDELADGASRQPVVLAAGQGAYLYLLGDAVRAFLRSREAPLRLITRDRDGTLEAVRLGEAHVGVTALDSVPDDVTAHRLVSVPQVLVVPRQHALARVRAVRIADLAGVPLILSPAEKPHRAALSRAIAGAGVEAQVAVEASGWELMLHFVKLGLGAAVVNGSCRVPAGLVAVPIRELAPVGYFMVTRRGARAHGPAASLASAIRSSVRRATP